MKKSRENDRNRPRRGAFITFEGPEGAGKSTQVRMLLAALEAREPGSAVATREPGGTPLAEKLRALFKYGLDGEKIDPRTELLLIEAGRVQHIEEFIRPALAAGKVVICDRFTDSTLAYQGAGRGIGAELVKPLNDFACAGITPDLTFILDIPVDRGLKRAAERSPENSIRDRLENERREFHERLRQGFLALAAADPERCAVIDASGTPEEVHREIWRICNERGL